MNFSSQARGRRQRSPFAWLGAGVLGLGVGVGVALTGGTGVAAADSAAAGDTSASASAAAATRYAQAIYNAPQWLPLKPKISLDGASLGDISSAKAAAKTTTRTTGKPSKPVTSSAQAVPPSRTDINKG